MKKMTTILMIFLLLGTVMSCQRQEEGPDGLQDLPLKSAELIDADNQFGLELFRKVTDKAAANANTMISPLSISLALTMTYNGAAGETKSEMEKTMNLHGLTTGEINAAHRALVNALRSADPSVQLEIANAIYYDHMLRVREEFVTVNKQYYDAEVTALDFADQASLLTINGWVSEKTRGKIPTIIDQLDSDLVMMLLNAVYFNGIWKTPFDEEGTHLKSFRFGNGTSGQVETMSMVGALEYTTNDLFSAVHFPYGKEGFRMTVILPHENKSTGEVIGAMDGDAWRTWMQGFRMEGDVEVSLPRFKFEWKMTLNDLLSSMGMAKAFVPYAADFSGMTGNRDLYIGYVIHKTYVDVNEKGTEAAAVTAVGMFTTSMPVEPPGKIRFTVNRPFLFTITEKSTGAILFIGEINAPAYN